MQPRCSNSFVDLRTGCGLFWNFKSLFPGEVQVTYFYVYRVSYNYTQLHNCHLHIIHTCKYRFDTQSGWFKPVFCLLLARLLTALTPSILAESFSLLIPFCVLPSKNEGASGMSGIHTSRCCTVVSLRQFESGNLDFQCVCFMWGTQTDVTRLCFGCFFLAPLLTVQAEFLERYGRLMPKEQWPQLVGPRHFGWFEGRCMKLILDARWHFKGLCNAGLLSFLWRFSTSNIGILFRLVGRLRTRQVEQPEKVKLLVAVATSVSQNTIPVRSYLCIIEFHEQQKGSSWSAHHRLGRQGPNPGQHKGFAWVANSFSWRICFKLFRHSESSQTWERIGIWQLLQMQPLGGAGQSTDHESFRGSPPQDAARSEAGLRPDKVWSFVVPLPESRFQW